MRNLLFINLFLALGLSSYSAVYAAQTKEESLNKEAQSKTQQEAGWIPQSIKRYLPSWLGGQGIEKEKKPEPTVMMPPLNKENNKDAGVSPNNQLLKAAESGNLAEVKHALSIGALINAKDINGRTALIIATRKGDLAIINELLVFPGIDVNAEDRFGWTADLIAQNASYKPQIKKLILKNIQKHIEKTKPADPVTEPNKKIKVCASKHARDRMAERGISDQEILQVLQTGSNSTDSKNDKREWFFEKTNRGNPLRVLVIKSDSPKKKVITAYRMRLTPKPRPLIFKEVDQGGVGEPEDIGISELQLGETQSSACEDEKEDSEKTKSSTPPPYE